MLIVLIDNLYVKIKVHFLKTVTFIYRLIFDFINENKVKIVIRNKGVIYL